MLLLKKSITDTQSVEVLADRIAVSGADTLPIALCPGFAVLSCHPFSC